jgi:hypothetical protein
MWMTLRIFRREEEISSWVIHVIIFSLTGGPHTSVTNIKGVRIKP